MKPGRNDPCPCGSGKKYKQCCLQREEIAAHKPVINSSIPGAIQNALEHHQAGRLPQAETIYRQVLQIEPDNPEALHLLGMIAHQVGRNAAAVELINKAISANSSNPLYHLNLGAALEAQGKLVEAVASFRKALSLQPDMAMAHYNLGSLLLDQGRLDEAIKCFSKATEINPDYAEAYSNFGNALQAQGKLDESVTRYRKAIALKPDLADAHNNLANSFWAQGNLDAAIEHYKHAISCKPTYADAHNNLGNALRDQGKISEAMACYQHALTIRPNFSNAYDNLLYLHASTRNISPEAECELAAGWEKIKLSESERGIASDRSLLFSNPPRGGRKLRVGVVSSELGQHAVAEFLEPVLQQLNRNCFHVSLYTTSTRSDHRTDRFRKLADEYKSLVGVPDNKAADLIRADLIDVLIDTTGHMSGCRLGIFAHRAAPVQCHYIGYHGTTGLTEMDWFIADEILLPSFCDAHFREKIWRLPRLRMSYRGDKSLPVSNWQPDSEGVIWLGSFNNLSKVREEALGLWAKIMQALPESKLLLKDRNAGNPSVQGRIRSELARFGISGERVEFIAWTPDWSSHMALYDRLDIALDTIPLNSETTAFDALWMGVPLVALEGNWMGGRMSSTLLKAMGKHGWVAQNEDEYVAIVCALAQDVGGRKALRLTQRELLSESVLCDATGLSRVLENAFEEMFDLFVKKRGENYAII